MIKFENISKKFGNVLALDGINFSVDDGEFVFISGPSGSGKTTILKLILGEIKPLTGKILVNGEDMSKANSRRISEFRQTIGTVFQDFKLLHERTVSENIQVALAVIGLPERDWDERVKHALRLVGLTRQANLFPSQLSGGEIQRVSLARALCVNPKIILADEPTGNLDWETSKSIVELFEKINKEGKTVIMVTHNTVIVKKYKKRVIAITNGKMVK